jgi:hypothetical protein
MAPSTPGQPGASTYWPAKKAHEVSRLAMILLERQFALFFYRMVAKLLCIEGWGIQSKSNENLMDHASPPNPKAKQETLGTASKIETDHTTRPATH